MDDHQLLRYSRHILLDDIGIEGQQRALDAHVAIIGAGGLGSPVALYLAAAGIGRLTLVDDDTVDLTNLQRQIAHASDRVGWPKVESAAIAARSLNPETEIRCLRERATPALLDRLAAEADVLVDCSDNFATRQQVNAACVRAGTPLVAGAALGFDGQVGVYRLHADRSPCYACLFPPDRAPEEVACSTMGVFAPLVGIIGTTQAAEALKIAMGVGRPMDGRLLMLDARCMEWSDIRIGRDPECPVCGVARPPPGP